MHYTNCKYSTLLLIELNFYQVSSSLQYAWWLQENMEINKYFDSLIPSNNIITMTGINLNNATLVSEGIRSKHCIYSF